MFCKRSKISNIKVVSNYRVFQNILTIQKQCFTNCDSQLPLAKMLPTTTTIFISFLIGETACCRRDYNK